MKYLFNVHNSECGRSDKLGESGFVLVGFLHMVQLYIVSVTNHRGLLLRLLSFLVIVLYIDKDKDQKWFYLISLFAWTNTVEKASVSMTLQPESRCASCRVHHALNQSYTKRTHFNLFILFSLCYYFLTDNGNLIKHRASKWTLLTGRIFTRPFVKGHKVCCLRLDWGCQFVILVFGCSQWRSYRNADYFVFSGEWLKRR